MSTPIIGLTAAVDAKTALFDRIKAEADGGLLQGVSVDYAWNAAAGLEQIYGGGWRSTQEDAVGEHGLLMREIIEVSVYVRVTARPPVPVAETDKRCKHIAATLGRIFHNDPHLAGGMTWLGVRATQGDYTPPTTEETVSSHAYAVQIGAFVTWGQ